MSTTMAVIALTGVMGGNVSGPVWLDDYRVAQARVTATGKPMVVFVGTGKAGWESVVREGGFESALTTLLSDKFVCLYVDANTSSGRSLADEFQVGTRGLIISDKSGRTQAYSASGTLPAAVPRALM